jgi:hypothetical protein
MKQLTLSITKHGATAVAVAVVSDNDHGGSAVPTFGLEALRLCLLYLDEMATAAMQNELKFVHMMNDGKTFDELRAERDRQQPIVFQPRPREPHNEN